MNVDVVLEQVAVFRAAGTLLDAAVDGGNNSDILVDLLWQIENREQLDQLVDGLDASGAVADRAERALRLNGMVAVSDDEIETWGYACLEQWVELARRRGSPGPVLDGFEALADMAVEVVAQHEQSDDASFPLNGSLLGSPADTDADLTAAQLAVIHGESFELLALEMSEGTPNGWGGIEIAFSAALEDDPMLGGWLLSPAASWQFDFEPFYNLWMAGVSLWVSPEMIEAVPGTAIRPDSEFGNAPLAPAMISDADKEWMLTAGPAANKTLSLIAQQVRHGGNRLDLVDFGLKSLPEAIFIEGGWLYLLLAHNPGLDTSLLSHLDRCEGLILSHCDLSSFDIAPPPGLQRVILQSNRLTHWPDQLSAAGNELTRLALQHNQLTQIPDNVGKFIALENLHLESNLITTVSASIAQLANLQYLGLSSNPALATLPEEILHLPEDCRISLHSTALPEPLQKAKTIAQLRTLWPG